MAIPDTDTKQKAVEDEVNRTIKLGIIERSKSPYSIPIVPVFKKNGEVRLCLDARKVNDKIIPDHKCPMPIDKIMTRFRNLKCISTLELRSGYWQIGLDKSSRAPCPFLLNGRNYSFTGMPFGLNISGSEFPKRTDHVHCQFLQSFVAIYIDDLLIISQNANEHYRHSRKVLEKFKEYNVRVNLVKCQFFKSEVTFLSHIISEKGIRMDQEKIQTVQDIKTQTKKREVQSYLGFIHFYRKYIN